MFSLNTFFQVNPINRCISLLLPPRGESPRLPLTAPVLLLQLARNTSTHLFSFDNVVIIELLPPWAGSRSGAAGLQPTGGVGEEVSGRACSRSQKAPLKITPRASQQGCQTMTLMKISWGIGGRLSDQLTLVLAWTGCQGVERAWSVMEAYDI